LADEDGLVSLQLIYALQLFLGRLDGRVNFLLGHVIFALDLVDEGFELSGDSTALLWLVIKPKKSSGINFLVLAKLLCLLVELVDLLLE